MKKLSLLLFLSIFNLIIYPMMPSIDSLVLQKHEEMKKSGNHTATLLHAAAELGLLDWIKNWVLLNKDKSDFKELLKKRDSRLLTARQIAIHSLNNDIANYLQKLES